MRIALRNLREPALGLRNLFRRRLFFVQRLTGRFELLLLLLRSPANNLAKWTDPEPGIGRGIGRAADRRHGIRRYMINGLGKRALWSQQSRCGGHRIGRAARAIGLNHQHRER